MLDCSKKKPVSLLSDAGKEATVRFPKEHLSDAPPAQGRYTQIIVKNEFPSSMKVLSVEELFRRDVMSWTAGLSVAEYHYVDGCVVLSYEMRRQFRATNPIYCTIGLHEQGSRSLCEIENGIHISGSKQGLEYRLYQDGEKRDAFFISLTALPFSMELVQKESPAVHAFLERVTQIRADVSKGPLTIFERAYPEYGESSVVRRSNNDSMRRHLETPFFGLK